MFDHDHPGLTHRSLAADSPDIILNELPGLAQDTDYVVADGPGSQTETSRALLLRADLAIVPCKASMLEVRALAKATEVLRQAQDIRGGAPQAIIVLSMIGLNYRLTQDMKDAAVALNLPMVSKSMILRQIYADAPGQRAVVWQMGARARDAAREIYTWLAHRLCRINQPSGVMLSWQNLREQFGQEYADNRDFKREFKDVLRQVTVVYPTARIDEVDGGLRLYESPPPITKTSAAFSLPAGVRSTADSSGV